MRSILLLTTMKKTAIALTAVLLLTGMATAVVDGGDKGDGDMTITKDSPDQTGDNSSSTETSPEDTDTGEDSGFNPLEAVADFVSSLFG